MHRKLLTLRLLLFLVNLLIFLQLNAISQTCDYPDGDFEQGPSAWDAGTWGNSYSFLGNGVWFQEGSNISSGGGPESDTTTIQVNGGWASVVLTNGNGTLTNPPNGYGVLSTNEVILNSPTVSWMQLDERASVAVTFRIWRNGAVVYTQSIAPNPRIGSSSNWALRQATVPSNLLGVPVRVQFKQQTLTQYYGWCTFIDDVCMDLKETVKFEIPDTVNNTRVLIHKYGPDGYYNTQFQTADRQFEIKTSVLSGTAPVKDKDVWLRVIDPPDSSPYAQSPYVGDNWDSPNIDPEIETLVCGTPPYSTTCTWRSDDQGVVRDLVTGTLPILRTTKRFSGDNYSIEASFDPSFSCSPNCAKSGILTAWKRFYIEYKKMYTKGQFLVSNASAGTTQLKVNDASVFQKPQGGSWPTIHIFSAANPTGEQRIVKSIKTNQNPNTITLNGPALTNSYPGDPACNGNPLCVHAPYSFVAIVGSDNWNYPFDATAFDDTFTEFKVLDGGHVPAWLSAPDDIFLFDRLDDFFPTTSGVQSKNLVALVSGSVEADPLTAGSTKMERNLSLVFQDSIASTAAQYGLSASVPTMVANTGIHELAHQWWVNTPPSSVTGGHCLESEWSSSGPCLMNRDKTIDQITVIRHFHNLSGTNDLFCIRFRTDDFLNETEGCNVP